MLWCGGKGRVIGAFDLFKNPVQVGEYRTEITEGCERALILQLREPGELHIAGSSQTLGE